MSYETYRLIFWGGTFLAGIMLIISIIIFFAFDIPDIIGNLTGRNARKAIKNINKRDDKPKKEKRRLGRTDYSKDYLTEKLSLTENLDKKYDENMTEKLESQGLSDTEAFVLSQSEDNIFFVEREITYIHTSEIIE